MASLHARHSRSCPLSEFTTFDTSLDGCECKRGPMYVVVVRQGRKTEKRSVGHNRKNAERAFRKVEVEVDEGAYRPQLNVRFAEWGERWLAALERKETTRDSYRSTIAYASEAFGSKLVRQLQPQDIAALNVSMRETGLSDSTRAKHLRVLGACLGSAVQHGYAARNPVRLLPSGEKPRPKRRESAYFENDELPRLFAAIPEGVYRTLFLVALKTGMREGELFGLTWGDVDLTEKLVHVRRSYTDGHLSVPKNHEIRDVPITDDVVDLLGAWWGECGSPTEGNVLVLAGGSKTGYLSNSTVLRRELYPAMARAGIERVGPTGEKRTFHSLRHTFAKRALESGAQITWLSRHLGHSSIKVTMDVYGHFERAERAKQAQLLEGAFGV